MPKVLPTRMSFDFYQRSYGDVMAGVDRDDISLAMYAGAVRRFVDSGVPTLVYVTPINVEHMRALGVYDVEGMRQTVASIEFVVDEAGGQFVDFHDLLPDTAFRDAGGHLTFKGDPNGSMILSRALAPHVVELLRPTDEARD